jgi:hypothetical protein
MFRAFLAFILLVTITAYQYLTLSGTISNQSIISEAELLILSGLIAFYLLVELIFLSRKKTAVGSNSKADSNNKDLAQQLSKSEAELAQAKRLVTELKSKEEQHRVKIEELKTALSSTTQELSYKKEEQRRDKVVDAEILHLMRLLQEKGRLVDFLMEDITSYQDNQVASAARVVHQGCRNLLQQYFEIASIHDAPEGAEIDLNGDFDRQRYRLLGSIPKADSYRGKVVHRGWQTKSIKLPRVQDEEESLNTNVISPVDVEVKK